MGTELIGWLAKGPLDLQVSPRHKQQIVAQLAQVADWWQGLGEEAEFEYADRVEECPIPVARSLIEDEECFLRLITWLTQAGCDVAGAPRQLIAARLYALLEWPPHDSTVAWTHDPDDPTQVMVFAGNFTDGDLPTTSGYRHLQLLALTGVGVVVGIKLIRPCITLTLTD